MALQSGAVCTSVATEKFNYICTKTFKQALPGSSIKILKNEIQLRRFVIMMGKRYHFPVAIVKFLNKLN